MKRFLISFVLLAFPMSASASADLALQWGQEAGRLSAQTTDMILAIDLGDGLEVSDDYARDVYRFGRTSGDLAKWIDQTSGPSDLGCIFRGMAAEADIQLTTLEDSTDLRPQRDSLSRLASMFADAEIIALAAKSKVPAPNLVARNAKQTCDANSAAVLEHLN